MKSRFVSKKKIAEERIRILFNEAEKRFDSNTELSNRYIKLAQRLGERAEISVPKNLKKHYCSNCNIYWRHGDNCRARIDSENQLIKYKCLECGAEKKYGY